MYIKKDIYKITNRINGKVYIGQSVNPEHRFKEHIYGKHCDSNSAIHNAIKKYGAGSFDFEVIEHDVEDYNEREKYWIKKYKSNDRSYGYNITEGGEDPPILRGEDSFFCKLKDSEIVQICLYLRDTQMTYEQIADKYNVCTLTIQHINSGNNRPVSGFKYPIRVSKNIAKDADTVNSVLEDLLNTCDSTEEISRKYDVDSNFVYSVNNGVHRNCPKDMSYPIRDQYCRISRKMLSRIYEDIDKGEKMFSQIEREYGLSHCVLSRINNGKIYRNDKLSYPIRKSSQRVYNPVETIPS